MRTIHKHVLELVDTQKIRVSVRAKVLSVHLQNDKLVMYVETDDEDVVTKGVEVFTFGTGDRIPYDDEVRYMNTVSTHNGTFMWHVYVKEHLRK